MINIHDTLKPSGSFPISDGLDVSVDSSSFNGILSNSDTDVQKALVTLDVNSATLPSQANQQNKSLTTNGVTSSWRYPNFTILDIGTISTAVNLNVSVNNIPRLKLTTTATATVNLGLTAWNVVGEYTEMEIEIINGGLAIITFPTINWVIGDGTYSTVLADTGVTFQNAGSNSVMVWSSDAGATIYGVVV